MLHLTISLRALVFVLLLGSIVFTGSDVAQGAPSQVDGTFDTLTVNGNIIFSGPGQDGAKDIRTSTNDGGLRIYNGNGPLQNPPEGAALQFYGNDRGTFNGQVFIDSGAHTNAAIILRTAGTGGSLTERMRLTSDGLLGIGTSTPTQRLDVAGFIKATKFVGDPNATIMARGNGTGEVVLQTVTGNLFRDRLRISNGGNVTIGGNVGIGVTTPLSSLHVAGDYIQFPTRSGSPPPAEDCNGSAEAGRVVVRVDGTTNLYICTGASGWVGK